MTPKVTIKMDVVFIHLSTEQEAVWRYAIHRLLKVLEEHDQAQSEHNQIQEATSERIITT